MDQGHEIRNIAKKRTELKSALVWYSQRSR